MNPIQHALEINNGKAILLSIKKEWLDKIMAGDKVMEVRKTKQQEEEEQRRRWDEAEERLNHHH